MLSQLESRSLFLSLAFIFFFLTVGVGGAGFYYFTVQKARIKQQTKTELSAVAALKVDEISRWRRERLADAHIVMDTPFIAQLVQKCFQSPGDPSPRQEIFEWMMSYKEHYDYYSVSLLDLNGMVRLSLPEGEETDADLFENLAEAMGTGIPLLGDLERSEIVPSVHLDLIVPLSITEKDDRRPVAALLLRIDPHKFLFPLIRLWPTPSPSAETLLVRREGNEVVFLNQLRHLGNDPLTMRLPLDRTEIPAVMAGQGYEGVMEGIDYRGSSVLAAIKRFPDAPWFLIAKSDTEECLAPVRARALLVALVAILLIAGAGVTLGLVWWYQRSRLYLAQYKAEAEKLEIAQRYQHLTRYANDIILLVTEDGRIAEANGRALTTYGYSLSELTGLNISNLVIPGAACTRAGDMPHAGEQEGAFVETVHCKKDGTRFAVEISTGVIAEKAGNLCMMIIRDISERKQAETALQEARDMLEQRVRERTADLLATNELLNREMEVRARAEEACRIVTSRLADMEETEKRRLGRELHDRVGQNLTALNFNLSAMMNQLSAETRAELTNRLRDSLRLVEDTVSCVRDVMADLRPPLLDDYGLAAVLRWYCREFSQRTGIPTEVKCEGYATGYSQGLDPRLPPSVEIALFRIAQEALTNVMRHAQASRVKIELKATEDEVMRMTISDDGVGLDPNAMSASPWKLTGWGLLGMRERAEMAGGRLQVDSAPGKGTSIMVEVARH